MLEGEAGCTEQTLEIAKGNDLPWRPSERLIQLRRFHHDRQSSRSYIPVNGFR
jgi:hypothetical protein